ncbi:glycosyltransferase family 4 protein [Candidatus Saccharibacteria bacterium]|nr:glycosyltransferase family 4 protein [Candidatus Saccharibacteria bacterium]
MNKQKDTKTILVIAPKTSNLISFRGDLLCDLRKKDCKIVAVVPEDEEKKFFKQNGIKVRLINLDKNSLSIFGGVSYYRNLKKIIKEEKPDKVFSYTIKPVIFGSIAAKKAGVKDIYSLICGLGILFCSDSWKIKLLRPIGGAMYKYALKNNKKVIFQNKEDIAEFVGRGYVKQSQCELVNGSGVNLKKFVRNKLPKNKVSFLMVSRILKEKGVLEYFKAAKIVKEKYPETEFVFAGAVDKNKNAVDMEMLQPFIIEGIVKCMINSKEIPKLLAESSVFVLPSYYREGIPKALIEATAMGRPIITTDTPGCKETVVEGKNGMFIKVKRANDLADKMIWMIKHRDKLQEMGDKSFEMCKEKFTIDIIDSRMMEIMEVN